MAFSLVFSCRDYEVFEIHEADFCIQSFVTLFLGSPCRGFFCWDGLAKTVNGDDDYVFCCSSDGSLSRLPFNYWVAL